MASPMRAKLEFERTHTSMNDQLLHQRHQSNYLSPRSSSTNSSNYNNNLSYQNNQYASYGSPTSPTSSYQNGRTGRSQPLHYRTNFGKDYGYRPPSPASPISSPTLLTQWSSQQSLQRKKQQLLQRQRQILNGEALNLPYLKGANYNLQFNSDEGGVIDDLPFDERDQRPPYSQQQRQQQQPYSPQQLKPPLSPTASSPQRVRLMFERGSIIKDGTPFSNHPAGKIASISLPQNNIDRESDAVVSSASATARGTYVSPSKLSNHNLGSVGGQSISTGANSTTTDDAIASRISNTSPRRSTNMTPPRNTNISPLRHLNMSPPRNTNASPPKNASVSPPNSRDNPDFNNDTEYSNRSPIARLAEDQQQRQQQDQKRTVNYRIPSALHVLYTSPVRLSSPKQSLSPYGAVEDDLSPPMIQISSSSGGLSPHQITTPPTSNQKVVIDKIRESENSEEEDDDEMETKEDDKGVEVDYAFQDDRYQDEELSDDRRNLLERYQFPKPRISEPGSEPLVDVNASISKKQYPVIGGPSLISDDASALTGDYTLDQQPETALHQNEQTSRGASNAPKEPRSPNSRFNWKNYENLSTLYKISPKSPQNASTARSPRKGQSTQASLGSTTTTSETSDNRSDSQHMGVVGVSRYLQDLAKEKEKKYQQPDQQVTSALNKGVTAWENVQTKQGTTPPNVENSISIKSEEDSLFDFIDSSATVSTTDNEPMRSPSPVEAPFSPRTNAALKLPDIASKAQPQYSMQQRPHQDIYGSRLVSILHESTTEDDASTDKLEATTSDDPDAIRTRAAWTRRKRIGDEKRLKSVSPPPRTPDRDTALLAVSTSESVGLNAHSFGILADDPESVGGVIGSNGKVPPRQRRVEYLQRRNEQQIRQQKEDASRTRSSLSDAGDSSKIEQSEMSTTMGTQSLTTLYTKSAESEIEDVMKDILSIGNSTKTAPGRRKAEYNRRSNQSHHSLETKDEDEASQITGPIPLSFDNRTASPETLQLQHQVTEDFVDTGTASNAEHRESRPVSPQPGNTQEVQDDNSLVTQSKRSSEVVEEKKEDDRILGDVWTFVGSRITAVTSALGLDVGDSKAVASPTSSNVGAGTTPVATKSGQKAPTPTSFNKSTNMFSSSEAKEVEQNSQAEIAHGEQSTIQSQQQHSQEGQHSQKGFSGWNILDFASDVLLGPAPVSPCKDPSKRETPFAHEPEVTVMRMQHDEHSIEQSLTEDETRLHDMAVQAAISVHRINGFDFDTSCEIDISHDIKFVVVELKLPLGLVFQENDKGCWITTVLPDGSAAVAKTVEPGDQLAAVDAINAIDMTVDEIAYLVRQHKRETVELTFIRYVGRFRPVAGSMVDEEGYEIMTRSTETPVPPVILPKNKLDEDDAAPTDISADDSVSRSCMAILKKRSPTKRVESTKQKSKAILSPFRKSATGNANKKTTKDDGSLSLRSHSSQNNHSITERSATSLSPRKKRGFSFFGGTKK